MYFYDLHIDAASSRLPSSTRGSDECKSYLSTVAALLNAVSITPAIESCGSGEIDDEMSPSLRRKFNSSQQLASQKVHSVVSRAFS